TYKVSTIALLPGPPTDASTTDIRIGSDALEIWLRTDSSIQRTSNGRVYEVRETRSPRATIEKLLLAAPTISFVERRLEASPHAPRRRAARGGQRAPRRKCGRADGASAVDGRGRRLAQDARRALRAGKMSRAKSRCRDRDS